MRARQRAPLARHGDVEHVRCPARLTLELDAQPAGAARPQPPARRARGDPGAGERWREREQLVSQPHDHRGRRDRRPREPQRAARERGHHARLAERGRVPPPPVVGERPRPVLLRVGDRAVQRELLAADRRPAAHARAEHDRLPVLGEPGDRVRGAERAEAPPRPADDVVERRVEPRVRAEVDVDAERVAAQRAADRDAVRVGVRDSRRLHRRAHEPARVRGQRRHPPAVAVRPDGDDDQPAPGVHDPPVVALERHPVRALGPPEREVRPGCAVRAQEHGYRAALPTAPATVACPSRSSRSTSPRRISVITRGPR